MMTVNPALTIKSTMTADAMNSIITFTGGSDEMLRISKDGFYIRGKRVPQDDKEAELVYNTFHKWLTWAALNRDYK
jgi:hypothetical protein